MKARIHPSLPIFRFVSHDQRSDGDFPFYTVSSIDIWKGKKRIQTIRFSGENVPNLPGSIDVPFEVTDVDCDGYKDLLVPYSVGVHGDAWYYLFRFATAQGRFVRYARFSDLPLKEVDCKQKVVHTYVNSGAAGCAYTAATYKWIDGELRPMWIEDQWPRENSTGFLRTTRMWKKGKEIKTRESVSVEHCSEHKIPWEPFENVR